MLALKCKIEIVHKDSGNNENYRTFSFDYVSSVSVKTSCMSLGDRADVVIPRNMLEKIPGKPFSNFFNRKRNKIGDYIARGEAISVQSESGQDPGFSAAIMRGDEITIQLGYEEFGLETVFKGYITAMEWGRQLTLKCEDKTFWLKKINLKAEEREKFDFEKLFNQYTNNTNAASEIKNKSNAQFESTTLKPGMRLDQFLDEMVKAYPYIRIFFREEKLYIVKPTEPASDDVHEFSPERNIIDDKSMIYTVNADRQIIITAVTVVDRRIIPKPKKKGEESKNVEEKMFEKISEDRPKTVYGKIDNYEKRIFYCPQYNANAESEEEIRNCLGEFAETRWKEYTTDNISGSFTAFGVPFVRKGDCVKLCYGDYRPEVNGRTFIVDAVNYTFGSNGYRQVITLGYQV